MDAAILRGTGRAVAAGFSSTRRSVMVPAAKFAGKTAAMGGLQVLTLGATLGVGAVGLAAIADRAAQRAMGDNKFVEWTKHGQIPRTNMQLQTPMVGRRASNLIGMSALYGGMGAGVYDHQKSRGWSLSQSMANGTVEVEKPGFMGATGSLTLAMHRQRYGRSRQQQTQQGVTPEQLMTHGTLSVADDAIRAVHMAHMAAL
jgi:hypothetical protein